MTINGDTIFADERMHFVRKSDGENFGRIIALGYTYYLHGIKLEKPILEKPEDFAEVED